MPNPYSYRNNPKLHKQYEYGCHVVCAPCAPVYNPYNFCQTPKKYSNWDQGYGGGECYTPCRPKRRRNRRRQYWGYGY